MVKFGMKLLKNCFDNIIAGGRMPEKCRESILVSIYQNKVQNRLKVWRKVLEEKGMTISQKQTEYLRITGEMNRTEVSNCKVLMWQELMRSST